MFDGPARRVWPGFRAMRPAKGMVQADGAGRIPGENSTRRESSAAEGAKNDDEDDDDDDEDASRAANFQASAVENESSSADDGCFEATTSGGATATAGAGNEAAATTTTTTTAEATTTKASEGGRARAMPASALPPAGGCASRGDWPHANGRRLDDDDVMTVIDNNNTTNAGGGDVDMVDMVDEAVDLCSRNADDDMVAVDSALHRLAEAAERKQEEEMVDVGASRPADGPAAGCLFRPPAACEFEVFAGGAVTATAPSPDSAIHSSAGYSPGHSPPPRNSSDASSRHASPAGSPVAARLLPASPLPPYPSPVPRRISLPACADAGAMAHADMTPDAGLLDEKQAAGGLAQPGISRQQLINSPCPVCGDKISGFHYGIFSCESCKGFFKRTVQNKKNYQCLRGAACPVSISTRKKCPACRFNKCLATGMKLEAIREDRTRGGRSTYQCSYTLPAGICPPSPASGPASSGAPPKPDDVAEDHLGSSATPATPPPLNLTRQNIPPLLKEIMDVEHLWFSTRPGDADGPDRRRPDDDDDGDDDGESMVQTLTNMADRRLFKLVKWCKSLPLFKNILIDDQIALLINAWCELLVFSCCFRSAGECPGVIRVSNEKSLTAASARRFGVEKWVEKMLNFADQLRRLKVDYYEYVSLKVIVLLTSDASGLKEPEHVRDSQEKVVRALQQYTVSHYPHMPSKFGELLLRMPELQRVCQGCKEMLCPRQQPTGETPGFNLLMELLRGDH